jgi:hypothetical protein
MKFERIKFERSGGFAGIRLAADIEAGDLSEDQRKEISELLDEADFEELPEKLAEEMLVSDEFVYTVTVETGKKEYKVLAGESALPTDIQPLLEILERIAKRQMRRKKE